jgi:DNA-binding HxlR family transcriptional regulator
LSEPEAIKEDTSQEEVLSGYFRPDIIPEDLPMLFPLLQAKESVEAFSALFSGSSASVLVRLMILREIGSRGDNPHWSPREIESMFSYVDETKLKSALLRLRNSGILIWLPDISRYQLSPLGRMALSALSTMMKFGHEEGSELGYITSQIAASQAMGEVNPETLEHLLSRLSELDDEFNRAIISGSESRIKAAEKKLESVWNWVEKGTEIMKIVTENIDLDRGAHGS